jgi:hypothetical protein
VELGEKQGGDEDGKRMDGAVLYGLFLFWVFFVALFTPATTKEMDGWCHDGAHTSSWARGVNFLASVSSCAIRLCPYVGWVGSCRRGSTAPQGRRKSSNPGLSFRNHSRVHLRPILGEKKEKSCIARAAEIRNVCTYVGMSL